MAPEGARTPTPAPDHHAAANREGGASPGRGPATVVPWAVAVLALLLAAFVGWQLAGFAREVERLQRVTDAAHRELVDLNTEVTRMRVEQRADGRGPKALLEQLDVYAGELASSRTPRPDYAFAQQQMQDVLRAFEAIGEDGVQPVHRRFDELDPRTAYPTMRWLLEAAVRCDPADGKRLAAEVLAGTRKPDPRLRWAAADLLLRTDRELAQRELRRILLTETSRGIDPDRAAAYGATLLDPAAIAVQGFHNFVVHYLRAEDPEAEATLLQVLTRTNQDVATLQETIEALGRMRSAPAARRIEELYLNPPGAVQNPLFLNKCLDALAAIRGEAVRPFLEEQLARAEHELVVAHINHLLQDK